MDHDGTLSNAGTDPVAGTTFASTAGKGGISDETLAGGADDYAVSVGELGLAYDFFEDAELDSRVDQPVLLESFVRSR